jgi:mannose/fructose/N-acetylgalactosamine-specific phosphotransferase system component IIC
MRAHVLQAVLVGIWGGFLVLERRAFMQAMLSRPLVGGTVTGWLLGDVTAGLFTGLVFELLHLGGASLGASQAEHDTLASVVGAAFAASMGNALGSDTTPAIWAWAILCAAPFAPAGQWVEAKLDARAQKYFRRAQGLALAGAVERATRQNLRAMWPQFVFYGISCFLAVGLGWPLATLESSLPLPLLRGLAWAYPAIGTLACALAISRVEVPKRYLIGFIFALAAYLLATAGFGGGFA